MGASRERERAERERERERQRAIGRSVGQREGTRDASVTVHRGHLASGPAAVAYMPPTKVATIAEAPDMATRKKNSPER